jgi:hypothetical protein
VPITRRYRRRRRHAALMLTVGKGHSLNLNISGKMNHSMSVVRIFISSAIRASRDPRLARFAPRAIVSRSRVSRLVRFEPRAIRASRDSRLAARAWRTEFNR